MIKKRLIARIDVKNEFVIKGIHLEGLRKIGDPNEIAKRYYDEGVDEIIFMDAVAAYYDRNNLSHIIEKATNDVFVPITVGGGIRSVDDIQTALNSGADKVAINTQAVRTPNFIEEASKIFGSQAIVASIDAKKISAEKWVVYTDNGREPSIIDVIDWVKELEQLGAGEIMLTSIDKEGTKSGFDDDLNSLVSNVASIPLIVSGGAGNKLHCAQAISKNGTDAIAIASILHYEIDSIRSVKEEINNSQINIRI
jgi:imidazole glycerol-phosphate synthase subunit HisF